MPSPRLEAVKTVQRILRDGAYSSIALSNSQTNAGLSAPDRALYAAIVRTVVERKLALDEIISVFVQKKPDTVCVCALYVGLAQILFMQKVPDPAACDETVSAVKALTDSRRAGFVNAVLRSVCRQKDRAYKAIEDAPLNVRYSLSKEICDMLVSQYPEQAESALGAVFSRPPLCLRVNTLRTNASDLAQKLAEKGVECTYDGDCVTVNAGADKLIEDIGDEYFVQGRNSQYAVKLLGARQGMTVIDVCACPGGKTLGAALDMRNEGKIYAFDIHANKLSLIERSAASLGIDIISVSERDSRTCDLSLENTADRVICDVPCSSLGVLASKPEIRYKDISSLDTLYKTQSEILASSAKYLKPGGRMVYSTCTFNKNENENAVRAFLAGNGTYKLVSERVFLAEDGYFDGFYAALIERTE